jgi:hypothetical protein
LNFLSASIWRGLASLARWTVHPNPALRPPLFRSPIFNCSCYQHGSESRPPPSWNSSARQISHLQTATRKPVEARRPVPFAWDDCRGEREHTCWPSAVWICQGKVGPAYAMGGPFLFHSLFRAHETSAYATLKLGVGCLLHLNPHSVLWTTSRQSSSLAPVSSPHVAHWQDGRNRPPYVHPFTPLFTAKNGRLPFCRIMATSRYEELEVPPLKRLIIATNNGFPSTEELRELWFYVNLTT